MKRETITALEAIVGKEYVISDEETMRPYECDGLSVYTEMPACVVLPASTDEVMAVISLCYQHKLKVVARGAGTGLSAGTLPLNDGLLLSLARLNRILDIDKETALAVVQPGVRNLAISEQASQEGLYYAPDPSSQIACSIGGNVAENAGGVHCLKYGLTVHNVVSALVVTAEGEKLVLGGAAYDLPGFDLLALITGSEGMLGIVTEITVRLLPVPEVARVILAGFDSVENAANAVNDIIANGIIPAGLEMMDAYAISAAEDFAKAGYPREADALLLCELDGSEEDVNHQLLQTQKILQQAGATTLKISESEEERARMWKGRKSAFPAVGRISPDYYCMDGTIPRSELANVLNQIHQLSRFYGLRVANVFHAGDGNLHPLILFDANVQGELEKTEEFGAEILRICVEAGGCITGEHGVGVEKINQMHHQFNDAELAQFHRVKAAWDNEGLLNPGKGIPEPKHCQEHKTLTHSQGKKSKRTVGSSNG
ncbi:FAD-linked oxidase C-terminal domain-containing protein [Grimontia sp. NTOU-MAR1]|uniref:FAD-linked oxidase C-terminal domain-containing protein n=1 Tax=Grimontia sp. NTOU-MAR1 TaxID=3111011 RepID=UPI002DBA117C|nr:FAD-linked oxidase C-terminal domain-containing protein [Grimontia sp. NTOU-MAR1]WRV99852.1 FAD-linked oxidase C-terminal domain-containing protein [Grimontia sp. NTOU-MAR1]